MLADCVVGKLAEAVIPPGTSFIAVDELHFFADSAQLLRRWQQRGVQVVATTVTNNMLGGPMPIFGQLQAGGVQYQLITCAANCDYCQATAAATLTARITPVGSTMVGGKESYRSCCPPCFQEHCVFVNPAALLADPELYAKEKGAILESAGLTETRFCEAVGAAIVALEQGHPI
jgi:thymidine kinase